MSHEHAKTYEEAVRRIKALVVADCFQNHFEPLDNDVSP